MTASGSRSSLYTRWKGRALREQAAEKRERGERASTESQHKMAFNALLLTTVVTRIAIDGASMPIRDTGRLGRLKVGRKKNYINAILQMKLKIKIRIGRTELQKKINEI